MAARSTSSIIRSRISAGTWCGPTPTTFRLFEKAVSPKTKAIFIELIANPGGVVTDIEAVSKIARKAGVPLIVDNTLATPYLCKPFDFGADIIVHSLTKFLGGHGNSIGGMIVDGGRFNWLQNKRYPMLSEPRPEYSGMVLGETFGNFAFAIACRVLGLRDLGPALSPFNAFLIITGIETLPLRMQRHSDNALAVAEWLAKRPEVAWVSYPGLPGDKYNALAKKYVPKGCGAVFTFGLKGGYDAGVKLVSNVKLFSHLANIGDTRSLIIHPASTTHKQLSDAQKVQAGAGPDVVRLSIGLEDTADIIADLEEGLTGEVISFSSACADVIADARQRFRRGPDVGHRCVGRRAALRITFAHRLPDLHLGLRESRRRQRGERLRGVDRPLISAPGSTTSSTQPRCKATSVA